MAIENNTRWKCEQMNKRWVVEVNDFFSEQNNVIDVADDLAIPYRCAILL